MQTVQLSIPLKRLLLLPFFLLIISGLLIPSDGGHGILSIKSLAFLSTVGTVILFLFVDKSINRIQFKTICFLLISLTFLLVWMLISLTNDETPLGSAWDQFKIFWITISVFGIATYLVSSGILSFPTLLKVVIYANCLYSTLKMSLVILHVLGVVNLFTVIKILGIRFMSMEILSTLPRLQTSIDIATPFLLFFFLKRKQIGMHLNKYFCLYYLLISTISIFLSFSRFLMFVGLLSIVLHGLTLRLEKIVRIIPIMLFSLIVGIAIIGVENTYTIIEKRFYSKENTGSDLDRVEQIDDLITEHMQFPLFGKGLGSFAENNIRDEDVKHSYEVQWVAFLMQFGLIGISIMLVGIVGLTIKILSRPLNRNKIALFILFLAWLFAGFTNPFLVSLTSGILFTLFYLNGMELAQPQRGLE